MTNRSSESTSPGLEPPCAVQGWRRWLEILVIVSGMAACAFFFFRPTLLFERIFVGVLFMVLSMVVLLLDLAFVLPPLSLVVILFITAAGGALVEYVQRAAGLGADSTVFIGWKGRTFDISHGFGAIVWASTILVTRASLAAAMKAIRPSGGGGYWVLVLTALLAGGAIFGWEQAAQGSEISSPLQLGLDVVGVLILLILSTPWWVKKRPGPEPMRYQRCFLWFLLNVFLAVATLGQHPWMARAAIGGSLIALLAARLIRVRSQSPVPAAGG